MQPLGGTCTFCRNICRIRPNFYSQLVVEKPPWGQGLRSSGEGNGHLGHFLIPLTCSSSDLTKSSICSFSPSRCAQIHICGLKVLSIPGIFEDSHELQLYLYFALCFTGQIYDEMMVVLLCYHLLVTLIGNHLIVTLPAYRDSEANHLDELVMLQQNHNSKKFHSSGNICSQDQTHWKEYSLLWGVQIRQPQSSFIPLGRFTVSVSQTSARGQQNVMLSFPRGSAGFYEIYMHIRVINSELKLRTAALHSEVKFCLRVPY